MKKTCPVCGSNFNGRSDKMFCGNSCKSNFHYEKRIELDDFYLKVDKQLKVNRKLLKYFNKAGKATIRSEILISEGFDPKYFTHYWKNGKGDVYLFVYEFGFLRRMENGKEKFVLITWQTYMG